MPTLAERWMEQGKKEGEKEGKKEGKLEGQGVMLKRQLHKRFGNIMDIRIQERLRNATPEQFELWADRILDAKSIEEIFAEEDN